MECSLERSFGLYRLARVTINHMPAAMSSLDLEKMGSPDAAPDDVEEEQTAAATLKDRLSGWVLRDGTLISREQRRLCSYGMLIP